MNDASEVRAKAYVKVAKIIFTRGATYKYVSPLGVRPGLLMITPDAVVFDYAPRWAWMKKGHRLLDIYPWSSVEPLWSAPRRSRWAVLEGGRIVFTTPKSSLECRCFAGAGWTEVVALLASSGDLVT